MQSMAKPVTCPGFLGDDCLACKAALWPDLETPATVSCELSDITACAGAPVPLDGLFVLTQDPVRACTFEYSLGDNLITWQMGLFEFLSDLNVWQTQAAIDYNMFRDIDVDCTIGYANDYGIGRCGDIVIGGRVGGHGGIAIIRPISPSYFPNYFICSLKMDPPTEQFWNEHSVNGTKYNFSIYSRRWNNQLQVQIDTDEI